MVLLRFGWSYLSGLISSCVKSFCKKKKKKTLFFFILFYYSRYLTEIKIYNNQLGEGASPPSPYLTCFSLGLMLHINILLSFHSRHIYESIIFNIEDNVWFRFGGMYIDFYLSVVFCLVPNNNNNVSLTTKIIFKYLLASWEMSFNFLASRTVNTCISLGSLLTWDLAYLQYFFNHLLLFNEKLPQSLTT